MHYRDVFIRTPKSKYMVYKMYDNEGGYDKSGEVM
jgi:hypothetical protein